MKKFLILILTIFITVNVLSVPGYSAVEDLQNSLYIATSNISEEIICYAKKSFPYQFSSIKKFPEQFGFNTKEVEEFSLGNAFNILKYNEEVDEIQSSSIYYFPIMYKSKIRGLFSVGVSQDGTFTSTLSKGYSDNLQKLKGISTRDNPFKIVNLNDCIFALNNDDIILLDKPDDSEVLIEDAKVKVKSSIKKSADKNSILVEDMEVKNLSEGIIAMSDPGGPIDSAYLSVPIVLQGNHPWCWAATCASNINYRKGLNLTASTVVKYIFGYEVNQGGTWSQMQSAYNHWGLYPTQESYLPYWQVENLLKNNNAIHTTMFASTNNCTIYGHAMTIRAFEEYSSSEKYYWMIDPNTPYYVSVRAYDNGNQVNYILNGNQYYWNYSAVIYP